MAGPSTREASPGAPARTSGFVTAVPSIVVLLILGLALRLIIAYVLLPGSGFPSDLSSFRFWADYIGAHGPLGFYDQDFFHDYPPVYLLILGAAGFVLKPAGGIGDAIKIVPMLADLGLALVVWKMAEELGASRRRALVAAGLVILNPITWFDSAIWGQADSVGALIVLLGIRELLKDRRESAAALAVLAALTKPQLGILAFIVGFVIIRRSVAPRNGEAADPVRILTSLGAGLITAAAVCFPFVGFRPTSIGSHALLVYEVLSAGGALFAGLGVFFLVRRLLSRPGSVDLSGEVRIALAAIAGLLAAVAFAGVVFDPIVNQMVATFGEYPYLTLNAYNPWALVTSAGGQGMARTLDWIHDAPWTDPNGASGPGYVIGPFSTTMVVALLGLVAVLVAGTAAAWRAAGSRVAELAGDPVSDGRGGSEAGAGSLHGGRDRVRSQELRALAVGCGVAAVLLALVLAGQLPFKVAGLDYTGRLPAAIVGDCLLLAILLGASFWAAWLDDRRSILVALAILSIAFFAVPTRAHERYLFPFFGVGAVLLAVSPRWRFAYLALVVANIGNLWAVLVQYDGIPAGGSVNGFLIYWGDWLRSAKWPEGIIWPIALMSATTGLVLLWALLQLRPRAVETLQRETLEAAVDPLPEPETGPGELAPGRRRPAWSADRPLPAGAGAVDPAAGAAGMAAPAAFAAGRLGEASGGAGRMGPAEPDRGPAGRRSGSDAFDGPGPGAFGDPGDEPLDEPLDDSLEEPEFVPSWLMSLWYRISRYPNRPDRSASLDREPRGRLDKLDLWVVAALVILLLSARVYRLGEPAEMHFDEVYHARTATEFLQDWRYGIPHDIYEWTHPHLAKYAIAGGITLFSDDRVTATSQLGVKVNAAAVQPRIIPTPNPADPSDPKANPDARLGDRLFIATPSGVNVYDLQTRNLVTTYPVAGNPSALSLAGDGESLYVGTADGRIWKIGTSSLDDVRLGLATAPTAATELAAQPGFAIVHLYAGASPTILAADSTGQVVSIDGDSGSIVGRGHIDGAADFALLGRPTQAYVAIAGQVTDPAAEAQALATAVKGDAGAIEGYLSESASPGFELPLNLPSLSPEQDSAVQQLVADGKLPGIQSVQVPRVIVAGASGLTIIDARQVATQSTMPLDAPATSIAIGPGNDDNSYVADGSHLVVVRVARGDTAAASLTYQSQLQMPGAVSRVYWDTATKVVQVLGRTPDGGGSTIYAIETNGSAVFSDARLPFDPVAWGADVTPTAPTVDRQAMLAFSADGSMASVDIGEFAFSWRIVGVVFGVLMAACLYLLARVLFRRRSVGLLVALFSAVDGMFFAQSRIAMNDTYVGGFLLVAYLLFALLYFGVWRNRWAFWVAMPLVGIFLGLALASKWVALYALASMGMLILIRSALGRLITILGLAAGTGVLGYLGIAEMTTVPRSGSEAALFGLFVLAVVVAAAGVSLAMRLRTLPDRVLVGAGTVLATVVLLGLAWAFSPAPKQNGGPNYAFFLLMLATTVVAAAVNAYHPVAWTIEEVWFAIVGPIGLGVAASLAGGLMGSGTLIEYGLIGVLAGIGAAAGFWVAGRWGFGPLAPAPGPDDWSALADPPSPAPQGWLRLGSRWGLPAAWMAGSLVALPLVIYVAFYLPWVMPWQPQTKATGSLPVLVCFKGTDVNGNCPTGQGWPAGHTGKTLVQLTLDMYNYHNDLRTPHAASSPWWAWPLDLKPVWFESISYAQDTNTRIYDGGNLALWWLAIPAMAFLCWQAFRRRSLALTLIGMAFFWQWLSWARIDRASFQYHFYTALPFFLLALAYFVAELWHGPSRRTWLLARVAAAAALVLAPLMWLARYPVCGLARVDINDYYRSTACGATGGVLPFETRTVLIGVILVAALAVLGFLLFRLERVQGDDEDAGVGWIAQLAVPVVVAGALLLWVGRNVAHGVLFSIYVPAEWPPALLLPLLAVAALWVLTVRDPRRYVLGVCVIGVLTFVLLYPNLSAFPMPGNLADVYNGILPTWLYGFQFAVNQQESIPGIKLISPWTISLTVFVLAVALVVAYAAWVRRVVAGYRRQQDIEGGIVGAPSFEAADPPA